jgi:hypothetical protein
MLKIDVNNFGPFDANVWGTVSDVFIVIVTAITAVYLYRTLKSQILVQKMQQSLTDIENERYRVEYKPVFELVPVSVKEIKNDEDRTESNISFKLSLLKNDARDVEIVQNNGTVEMKRISLGQKGIGINMPVQFLSPPNEFNLHFHVSTTNVLYLSEGGYFFFYLNFSDTLGNRYQQLFTVIFQGTDFKFFKADHPTRLS